MVIKIKDREEKIEVMKKKIALRGKMVRIEDDWTRRERAIQCKLEEMARREKRNNRKVWVGYGKMDKRKKVKVEKKEREKLVDRKSKRKG